MHLAVLVWIGLCATWACGGAAPDRPERILLVSIDTLRADRVGCYGARGAHTPNFDAAAAAGTRFASALSPIPLTLPAHASLMTGADPPRHGVRHNSIHKLGPELPTLAERLRDAGYATAAFVGALVLDHRFGLDRGFDVYDDRTHGRVSGGVGFAERTADEVVDATLAWLAEAPPRFFLFVHFYDPHSRYSPPPGFASAFAGRPYDGEVAFVDAELGRLLGAIRERFGEAGLLLALTSDHGEGFRDHGEATHAYTLYESTQRIPLVLAGPGVPEGALVEEPVSLVDVAPTLLALAGAAPLGDAAGRDLLGERAAQPRLLYMETLAPALDFGWSPLVALRSGSWKYIRAPRPELYDLLSDPQERADRSALEPERAAELAAAAERKLAEGRAPVAADLPASDLERLRSLGYVVPPATSRIDALLEAKGLPDPKDRLWILDELYRAEAELEEGEAAAALARLDALDGAAGTSVEMHQAAAALAAGAHARAERLARAVLAREPTRTDMRILLARSLSAQGRDAEAGRALAALPPDVAPAPWVALAAAGGELAEGRRDAALLRLERSRARHPDDLELVKALAALLEEAGRQEEALAVREEGLARAPDDPALSNDVAWSLAQLGRDLDRALRLVRLALGADANNPAFLDTMAMVQLARGQNEAALEAIEAALSLAEGPTRAHLLRLRAEALGAGAGASPAAPQGPEVPGKQGNGAL